MKQYFPVLSNTTVCVIPVFWVSVMLHLYKEPDNTKPSQITLNMNKLILGQLR